MKRITLHWTAGTHSVSDVDRKHYHVIIDGWGRRFDGIHPISANRPPLQSGKYAAHTRDCNSDSIGVAVAAMAGAMERPFDPGKWPISEVQLDALVKAVAALAKEYGIPVTRETILTHAEVQPTLGIKQRGKWDICWIPGMEKPGDPVLVGDTLRRRIVAAMEPQVNKTPKPLTRPAPHVNGFWANLFAAIFGGKK